VRGRESGMERERERERERESERFPIALISTSATESFLRRETSPERGITPHCYTSHHIFRHIVFNMTSR
jgi:hypothetical protein